MKKKQWTATRKALSFIAKEHCKNHMTFQAKCTETSQISSMKKLQVSFRTLVQKVPPPCSNLHVFLKKPFKDNSNITCTNTYRYHRTSCKTEKKLPPLLWEQCSALSLCASLWTLLPPSLKLQLILEIRREKKSWIQKVIFSQWKGSYWRFPPHSEESLALPSGTAGHCSKAATFWGAQWDVVGEVKLTTGAHLKVPYSGKWPLALTQRLKHYAAVQSLETELVVDDREVYYTKKKQVRRLQLILCNHFPLQIPF